MLQIIGFGAPGKANLPGTLGPHCQDLVPTFRAGCFSKSTVPAFSSFSDLKTSGFGNFFVVAAGVWGTLWVGRPAGVFEKRQLVVDQALSVNRQRCMILADAHHKSQPRNAQSYTSQALGFFVATGAGLASEARGPAQI